MKNKENLSQTAVAIRQCKKRAVKLLNERETRLAKDCENKRIKVVRNIKANKVNSVWLEIKPRSNEKDNKVFWSMQITNCLNRQDKQPTDDFNLFPNLTVSKILY